MAERGAPPKVPRLQRRVLNAIRAFTSPLLPDDYLELINPLWSTRELRGKIESIDAETPDAATVTIRPGYEWEGHRAGQYLRIGLDINGRRHWRAYSLTSDPGRARRLHLDHDQARRRGHVSPYLVRRGRPGSIVSLGGVEGEFVLPDPLPEKLLFISAGSGITPIMSMLRSLEHQDALGDVVLIHSARNPDDVIFGDAAARDGEAERRIPPARAADRRDGALHARRPRELCPDWKEREAFISGPAELLDALDEHWDEHADCDRLHMERFQPIARRGRGGRGRDDQVPQERLRGALRRLEADPRGRRGRRAHAPVRLPRGRVPHLRRRAAVGRDPRPAHREGPGSRGEMVRTCINAPEGPVEIEL